MAGLWKRIVFFCLLCQTSYAQTKETSLAWIKDKITQNINRDYCNNKIYSVEIDACVLKFKYGHRLPKGKKAVAYYLVEIPTKDLRINYQGCFVLYDPNIKEVQIKSIKNPQAVGDTAYYADTYSSININLNVEPELFEKLNQEISKLNRFCDKALLKN